MRRSGAFRLVPVAAASWTAAGVAILAPAASPWIALSLWAIVGWGSLAVLRAGIRGATPAGTTRHGSEGDGASAGSTRTADAGGRTRLRMPRHALRRALVVAVLAAAASAAAASHVAWAQPARAGVAGLAIAGGRAVDVRAEVSGKI